MASCSGDRETVNRLADGIWWARKGRNPPSVTMRRPIMKPPPHISLSRSALLLLFHPLLWLLLSIRLNRSVVDLIVSSSRHLFSLSLSLCLISFPFLFHYLMGELTVHGESVFFFCQSLPRYNAVTTMFT
jgi:hypothetical protein